MARKASAASSSTTTKFRVCTWGETGSGNNTARLSSRSKAAAPVALRQREAAMAIAQAAIIRNPGVQKMSRSLFVALSMKPRRSS